MAGRLEQLRSCLPGAPPRRWRFRWPRSGSIRDLLLYAFGAVSLPLILAVGYAAVTVDRLAEQSQDAVYQAAQATRASRALVEQLTSMERHARQYVILGDPELVDAYRRSREVFRDNVAQLRGLRIDPALHERVSALVAGEAELFAALETAGMAAEPRVTEPRLAERFDALQGMAEGILAGSNQLIDREVAAMQRDASRAQSALFWLAAALIPLAVVLSAAFTVLIARPIHQIDRAIRRLGDTRFDRPVAVEGPRDLEYLGSRLDWLRLQLKEVEDQKTRFLRHVSHELKTPLASLREGVGLLDEDVAGTMTAEQREIVAILDANIRQLTHLIEDLLDFSNAAVRAPPLNRTPQRLDELAASALRHQKTSIMSKSLQPVSDLEAVTVEADPDKMTTVLDNLLANAIKYSPPGGTLEVRLRAGDAEAVLDVLDEGPGIPAEERSRVFDAFFQGQRQAEGYVKGSGLGLAIVREYVRAHGGSVQALGRTGSTGTDMRVTLPLPAGSGQG